MRGKEVWIPVFYFLHVDYIMWKPSSLYFFLNACIKPINCIPNFILMYMYSMSLWNGHPIYVNLVWRLHFIWLYFESFMLLFPFKETITLGLSQQNYSWPWNNIYLNCRGLLTTQILFSKYIVNFGDIQQFWKTHEWTA